MCLIFGYRFNTLAAYLITPAMGAHFTMYLASMAGDLETLLRDKLINIT
jgi:hypothetical protein